MELPGYAEYQLSLDESGETVPANYATQCQFIITPSRAIQERVKTLILIRGGMHATKRGEAGLGLLAGTVSETVRSAGSQLLSQTQQDLAVGFEDAVQQRLEIEQKSCIGSFVTRGRSEFFQRPAGHQVRGWGRLFSLVEKVIQGNAQG